MHNRQGNAKRLWLTMSLILCLVLGGCKGPVSQQNNNPGTGNETGITATVLPESDSTSAQDKEYIEESTAAEEDSSDITQAQECEPIKEEQADIPGQESGREENTVAFDLKNIPKYDSQPYVIVNDNEPTFKESELVALSFELYGELDELGRCTTAFACIGKDIMPTQEREGIGQVKPSGWHTVKYDHIDGKYLFNRCHLIGFQLAGENANEKNLITGTRYMNVEGMLPFENMIADYVRETGNHVLYRVTPVFDQDNLVAGGVQMEAYSIEDNGDGICFNVFCYNVQPRIKIDYKTGQSSLMVDSEEPERENTTEEQEQRYVLNINSKKFHYPECKSVTQMSEKNKKEVVALKSKIVADGFEPCGNCKP